MKVKLSNLKISHIATALPRKIVRLEEYADRFGEKNVRRIKKSTGVEQMHMSAEDMCASDYGVELAKRLMNKLGRHGEDFDGIVFISQSPDYIMPATGCIIQDRLKLPETAVSFDINCGCTGYVFGLYQAALLISSGSCRRVLVFTGDTHIRMTHELDRSGRMLFGDGYSVSIVERGNENIFFNINNDGSKYKLIITEAGGFRRPKSAETREPTFDENGVPHWAEYISMNGLEVMNFALARVPKLIEETLADIGWTKADVGTFAFHQANQFMLRALASVLKIEPERMPIALKNTGNTSSSSIPLLLSIERDRLKLDKTILCGFGVGMSWGAIAADLSKTIIHDVEII